MGLFFITLIFFTLVVLPCLVLVAKYHGFISPISIFLILLFLYYFASSISLIIEPPEFYANYFQSKIGTEQTYTITLIYVTAIIVVFTLPLLHRKRRKIQINSILLQTRNSKIRVTEFVIIANLLIGSYAMYYFVSGLNIGSYFEFVSNYRYGNYKGSSKYTYWLIYFHPILCTYLLSLYISQGNLTRFRKITLFVLISSCMIILLASGLRIMAIPHGMIFFWIVNYKYKRISPKVTLLLGVSSLILLAFYGLVRESIEQFNTDFSLRENWFLGAIVKVFIRTNPIEVTAMCLLNGDLGESQLVFSLIEPFKHIYNALVPNNFRLNYDDVVIIFSKTIMLDYRNYYKNYNWGGDSPVFPAFIYWQFGLYFGFLVVFYLSILLRWLNNFFLQSTSPAKLVLSSIVLSHLIMAVDSPGDSLNACIFKLLIVSFFVGMISIITFLISYSTGEKIGNV